MNINKLSEKYLTIVIDLKNVGQYNKLYGFDMTTRIIKHAIDNLKNDELLQECHFFRIGGDEYAVFHDNLSFNSFCHETCCKVLFGLTKSIDYQLSTDTTLHLLFDVGVGKSVDEAYASMKKNQK